MPLVKTRKTGRYLRSIAGSEEVWAFSPAPLPPSDPAIDLPALADRLRGAEEAVARLDLAGTMLPSLDWFLYAFLRKEAVISSQIEGTQATLIDLLNFEAHEGATPDPDIEDVVNHLKALGHARAELARPDGLPLSIRLLNESHRRLMEGARGASKQPGEIRRSQNWIGGNRPGNAVYVPPPPHLLPELLSDLERYLHAEDDVPPLLRVALAHAQFETIHPYLDGNGRIGRLLIALMLEHLRLLGAPLLYLSHHFKRHRAEYYRRLNAIRAEGDWEGWLGFFLDGVTAVAEEAIQTIRKLFALVAADRARVLAQNMASVAATRLFDHLPHHPVISIATARALLATSKPTAIRAVETLIAAGILVETTGRKRDRRFAYKAYIDLLRGGTELASE
ncbi:MAG: Fic family protein [Alphaproteobacteria bacterium]|nr:Fic family protein [Alphaproteobacteria bacterium]